MFLVCNFLSCFYRSYIFFYICPIFIYLFIRLHLYSFFSLIIDLTISLFLLFLTFEVFFNIYSSFIFLILSMNLKILFNSRCFLSNFFIISLIFFLRSLTILTVILL